MSLNWRSPTLFFRNSVDRVLELKQQKNAEIFAFENDFHNRLISIIHPENNDSKNVALNNGMTFKKQIDYSGNTMDLFQIEKTAWKKSD